MAPCDARIPDCLSRSAPERSRICAAVLCSCSCDLPNASCESKIAACNCAISCCLSMIDSCFSRLFCCCREIVCWPCESSACRVPAFCALSAASFSIRWPVSAIFFCVRAIPSCVFCMAASSSLRCPFIRLPSSSSVRARAFFSSSISPLSLSFASARITRI